MALRNSNPVFNRIERDTYYTDSYAIASYKGVGLKVLFYIIMTLLGAFVSIILALQNVQALIATVSVTALLSFIFALIAMMVPKASMICGTIYCLFQGVLIGTISLLVEMVLPGVVIVAVAGTLSIVMGVAVIYLTGLVKVTSSFVKFVMLFAIGFIICMLLCFILQWSTAFNLFDNVGVFILVSSLSLLLACFFLILDMAQVKRMVETGQPKQYEWMVAFGLTYTILWIYIQVLRLVAVIAASRN